MLPDTFRSKNIGILLVGFSATARSLLSAVLKEMGYPSILYSPDFAGAVSLLKSEKRDWILAPLLDESGSSVVSFMETIRKVTALADARVSLFRGSEDSEWIEKAFRLGAISCHQVSGSRDEYLHEIRELTAMFALSTNDDVSIAAHYFLSELMGQKRYTDIEILYVILQRRYPHNHSLTLLHAEALYSMGQQKKALATLFFLRTLAKPLPEQVDALLQKLGEQNALQSAEKQMGDFYDLKLCLIVDPADDQGQRLSGAARKIGFKQVVTLKDPLTATQWLNSNPAPDLIICEWTLPKIPGPIFLYRLRNKHGLQLPLIICNEEITERDAIMINELGASVVLKKPLDEAKLPDDILWTVTQHRNPTDYKIIRRQLTLASQTGDKEKEAHFKNLLKSHPDCQVGDLSLVEAILSYNAKRYEEANQYASVALNNGGDLRESMEILGKSFMKLRQFELATRCLEDVRYLSPSNVNHLCCLAECYLEQNEEKLFDEMVDAAKSVDKEDPNVVATEVKGALKRKHIDQARDLMQKLKSYQDILAFMNNRAVSLIHTGKNEEAFDLYLQTIAALPRHRADLSAIVHYNLGMGYARSNKLDDAKEVLTKAIQGKNPDVATKARRLFHAIEKAQASGKSLSFAAKSKTTEAIPDNEELLAKLAKGPDAAEKAPSSTKLLPGLMEIFELNEKNHGTDPASAGCGAADAQDQGAPSEARDVVESDDENIVID